MNPASQRVVHLIERLQDFYVMASVGLTSVGRDDWPNLLAGVGLDEGSSVRLGRRHGDTYYEGLDVYDAFRSRHGSGFNLDFLGMLAGFMILTIGDAAVRERVQDKSEVMQFLRHARNAVAHGNEFDLRNGEPKAPSMLRRPTTQGGDLEITAALNGDGFLLEFMSTGRRDGPARRRQGARLGGCLSAVTLEAGGAARGGIYGGRSWERATSSPSARHCWPAVGVAPSSLVARTAAVKGKWRTEGAARMSEQARPSRFP